MLGSTRYVNREKGVEISVSKPVERYLGPQKVDKLVELLTRMMAAMGSRWGYVSKRGTSLEITVTGPIFGTASLAIEKRP